MISHTYDILVYQDMTYVMRWGHCTQLLFSKWDLKRIAFVLVSLSIVYELYWWSLLHYLVMCPLAMRDNVRLVRRVATSSIAVYLELDIVTTRDVLSCPIKVCSLYTYVGNFESTCVGRLSVHGVGLAKGVDCRGHSWISFFLILPRFSFGELPLHFCVATT